MKKKILCLDGIKRTYADYCEWLANLQELAEEKPELLTEEEYTALQNEGLYF